MRTLRKNMWFPSLMDDLFNDSRLDVSNYENFSTPKVNISENLTTFVLDFAMPGMKKEDFAIEIDQDLLIVSSNFSEEKSSSDTESGTKFTRKEFNFGRFSRSFNLPENVSKEGVEATYKEGILCISIPKLEEQTELKRMVEIS